MTRQYLLSFDCRRKFDRSKLKVWQDERTDSVFKSLEVRDFGAPGCLFADAIPREAILHVFIRLIYLVGDGKVTCRDLIRLPRESRLSDSGT